MGRRCNSIFIEEKKQNSNKGYWKTKCLAPQMYCMFEIRGELPYGWTAVSLNGESSNFIL